MLTRKLFLFIFITLIIGSGVFYFYSGSEFIEDEFLTIALSYNGIFFWEETRSYCYETSVYNLFDNERKTLTRVFTNDVGMINVLEKIVDGEKKIDYDLNHLIHLWTTYNRFTDPKIDSSFSNIKIPYTYFAKNGTPFFSDSLFYRPDGSIFNGEILSNWSSQVNPSINGQSKITFREGMVWQIAETSNDSSIVYLFDMDKIIYLYNHFSIVSEDYCDSLMIDAMSHTYHLCSDSTCHFYHPLETIFTSEMPQPSHTLKYKNQKNIKIRKKKECRFYE